MLLMFVVIIFLIKHFVWYCLISSTKCDFEKVFVQYISYFVHEYRIFYLMVLKCVLDSFNIPTDAVNTVAFLHENCLIFKLLWFDGHFDSSPGNWFNTLRSIIGALWGSLYLPLLSRRVGGAMSDADGAPRAAPSPHDVDKNKCVFRSAVPSVGALCFSAPINHTSRCFVQNQTRIFFLLSIPFFNHKRQSTSFPLRNDFILNQNTFEHTRSLTGLRFVCEKRHFLMYRMKLSSTQNPNYFFRKLSSFPSL